VFVFESVVSLVLALARTPPVSNAANPTDESSQSDTATRDVFDVLLANDDDPVATSSVATGNSAKRQTEAELLGKLKNLGKNIEIYLKKLQTGQGLKNQQIGPGPKKQQYDPESMAFQHQDFLPAAQQQQSKKRPRVERKTWFIASLSSLNCYSMIPI
jgi:hypothetical protein